MFKTNINRSQKNSSDHSKPVSAVLFHFVFPVRRISRWEKKALLSRVKLFKPPVEHGTISIVQKTFLPTGVR